MKKLLIILIFGAQSLVISIHCDAQWQMTNLSTFGLEITCIAANDSNIYVGVTLWEQCTDFSDLYGNLWVSTDNGTNWKNVLNEPIVSIAFKNSYVFAGSVSGCQDLACDCEGDGLLYSTNNGESWDTDNGGDVSSVLTDSSYIFEGTMSCCGVLISDNNGTSWTQANSGLPKDSYGYFYTIASLYAVGSNILANVEINYGSYGQYDSIIKYESTNNGLSWQAYSNGLPKGGAEIAQGLGLRIFAGTSNGVYLSTNNGTSWTQVSTGLQDSTGKYFNINSIAISGSNIFVSSAGNGVFLSENNGLSWTAVNAGLTNLSVSSLAINNSYVFAVNNKSVWKRALSEMVGVNEFQVPGSKFQVEVYPNPVDEITNIKYQISNKSQVIIKVYDIMGRELGTLVDGMQDKGGYSFKYDVEGLREGLYFVKLLSNNTSEVVKFVKQ